MSTHIPVSLGALACLLALSACGGGDTGDGDDFAPAQGGFGARLDLNHSYIVVLMVADSDSNVIDYVGIACAPGGSLGTPVRVEENVELDGRSFTAESDDVAIDGEFVSSTEAEGTIREPSVDAQGCGLSDGDTWSSTCELTVEAEEDVQEGDLFLGDSSLTTDGGTAYELLEVVTADGRRLTAETGSCAEGGG